MFFVYIDIKNDEIKLSSDLSIKPELTQVYTTSQEAISRSLEMHTQRKESLHKDKRIAQLKTLQVADHGSIKSNSV